MASAGFAFGIFPLLLLNLLTGGGNDLLDYLPTDAYWRQKSVSVSVDTMMAELKPAAPAGDISKLIEELGLRRFQRPRSHQQEDRGHGASGGPATGKGRTIPRRGSRAAGQGPDRATEHGRQGCGRAEG